MTTKKSTWIKLSQIQCIVQTKSNLLARTVTWQQQITISNRRYIFKWLFHFHVSFWGCSSFTTFGSCRWPENDSAPLQLPMVPDGWTSVLLVVLHVTFLLAMEEMFKDHLNKTLPRKPLSIFVYLFCSSQIHPVKIPTNHGPPYFFAGKWTRNRWRSTP